MFSKIRRFGSRKVSIKTAVFVVALVLFAVTAIAARYESLTVGVLEVDKIQRLSVNHPLDIHDADMIGAVGYNSTELAPSGAVSDFTVSAANIQAYNVFYVDPSGSSKFSQGASPATYGGSGTTVNWPAVTTAILDKEVWVVNKTGTTPFAIYGTAIAGQSGTTHGYGNTTDALDVLNDVGDCVALRACDALQSDVSWWVTSTRYKH